MSLDTQVSLTHFVAGHVFNELDQKLPSTIKAQAKSVHIRYPTRLEAMALDPSKVVTRADMKYRAGQIDLTVALFRDVKVALGEKDEIDAHEHLQALIKHAVGLMRAALGVKDNFKIEFKDGANFRHCGLGSSSGTVAAVASAINELYGKPIEAMHLIRYLAQNHGEDIDGDTENLIPVQCLGGSAGCGQYEGSLFVVAGENQVIATANIPEAVYSVVMGIPNAFLHPDANTLMSEEAENFDGFVQSGNDFSNEVAYRMLHDVIPAMQEGDLATVGELIYDYRWRMGSINNCAFVFPPMKQIAKQVETVLEGDRTPIVPLSSVGPGFFAVTKDPKKIKAAFESMGLHCLVTKPFNQTYRVIGD